MHLYYSVIVPLVLFMFGLATGSFLNVVIHRFPREQSVVRPPSACPSCKRRLTVGELVPVAGYIFLRGRCAGCSEKISPRYPLVELATGLIFIAVWWQFGPGIAFIRPLFLLCLLLVISIIDLDYFRVPNVMVVTGLAAGVVFQLILPADITWGDALLGVLVGGGTMLLVVIISRGGMGAGDFKLMAMIGFYLGPGGTALTMFIGFLLGAAVGLVLMIWKNYGRKDPLPFAPFLSLAALTVVFAGDYLITWYVSTFFMM